MRFEHFAINVEDAVGLGDWLVTHLGFVITRAMSEPPFTRFLADDSGRVVVELYSNPGAEMLDLSAMHPLVFHLALAVPDAAGARKALECAGAVMLTDDILADGSHLVMMRAPSGLPVQLCQRAIPFP
jgi:glyoxylase I family protein